MSESIVKPLVWTIVVKQGWNVHTSAGLGCTYECAAKVWNPGWMWGRVEDDSNFDAEDEDSAKAAAQSDYEQRILSALSPSFASLQEENEALKQRLSTAYRVKAECNDDANRERHLRVIVQEENEALKARIAELTAALKFYADAWCFTPNPKRAGLECKPKESLLDDCGNIARAAIANKTAEADNGRRN